MNDKKKEKENILKLFRKGLITTSDVEIQLADIKSEENKISNVINTFKQKKQYITHENNLIKKMSDKFKYYNSKINDLTFEDKYNIVHLLVKKIVINTTITDGRKLPDIDISYNLVALPPTNDDLNVKFDTCTDALVEIMVLIRNVLVLNIKGKGIFLSFLVLYLIE